MEELRASMQSDYEEMTRATGLLPAIALKQHGGLQKQATDRLEVRFEVDQDRLKQLRDSGMKLIPRNDDMYLLTRKPFNDTDALKESRPRIHALAILIKTESLGGQLVLTMVLNLSTASDTEHVASSSCRPAQVLKSLLPRASWAGLRVTNLTPNMRELLALSSVHSIEWRLRALLLDPCKHAPAKPASTFEQLPLPLSFKARMARDFNESQLQAIAATASNRDQVTLVQGPPGTGKTAAIVGFISSILHLRKGSDTTAEANVVRNGRRSDTNTSNSRPDEEEIHWEDQVAVMESGEHRSSRILVCAQSNAAIDELLMRLAKRGLYSASGGRRPAAVVRMGVVAQDCKVGKFHIDEWANRRTHRTTENAEADAAAARASSIKQELQRVQRDIEAHSRMSANAATGQEDLDRTLQKLTERRRELSVNLDRAGLQAFKASGMAEGTRREERAQVLKDAEVVLCTLSSAGGDLLQLSKQLCAEGRKHALGVGASSTSIFDALIIDEAAQAIEPAALIPMQLLRPDSKIILVGDTNQLPPTVLSQIPGAAALAQSLFARMQSARFPVVLLQHQYRMHPAISKFPRNHFYDGKLLDGIPASSASFHQARCFGPYVFMNCSSSRERFSAASICNPEEVELIAEMLTVLFSKFPHEFRSLAVLTPYRAQKKALEQKLFRLFGATMASSIVVSTVDGYQGQEADIVIFSCVRADSSDVQDTRNKGVGFLADVRRLNVAITRAQRAMWIVGHSRTLQRNATWKSLVQDAKSRDVYLEARRPYKGFFRSLCEQCSTSDVHDDRTDRFPSRRPHSAAVLTSSYTAKELHPRRVDHQGKTPRTGKALEQQPAKRRKTSDGSFQRTCAPPTTGTSSSEKTGQPEIPSRMQGKRSTSAKVLAVMQATSSRTMPPSSTRVLPSAEGRPTQLKGGSAQAEPIRQSSVNLPTATRAAASTKRKLVRTVSVPSQRGTGDRPRDPSVAAAGAKPSTNQDWALASQAAMSVGIQRAQGTGPLRDGNPKHPSHGRKT
mmetsp:Transcript_9819/g.28099  ORF Transcript_9819/g.28099 Transcript_9819/m.28099 type:complete len:1016 (-) Transcript_9819:311-3358(-)